MASNTYTVQAHGVAQNGGITTMVSSAGTLLHLRSLFAE